ncbi:PREDICTED: B-cell receptor CD22 isoform X1 [Dipodomys ordii]|uniref:B-cell receptor CD22 isoform X1 n=1 Tax=Dipodomys ordii TaxID=10020 RepID=A0A1S3FYN8_DIPOR|nr:PREDICTED: B-cell receptor CD22 isoform X1 [Dipodomys ordii]XP_012881669.1 PREDICTED: B-cell receptor CD22 isoform X1 [Dipodomys ordii]
MPLLLLWLLLLLEHLPWSDSNTWDQPWTVEVPKTLYSWEGVCLWIPCRFSIPKFRSTLDNLILLHDYEFDDVTKEFNGTVLYKNAKPGMFPPEQGRTHFLGDKDKNCTLSLDSVSIQDSGRLGLRLTSGPKLKWMEKFSLNVSKTPLPPRIQLPTEIRESQPLTATCLLEFACPGYPVQLWWSQEGSAHTSVSLSVQSIYTRSDLTFQAQWTDHGKTLTCQVRNFSTILSKDSVKLCVKHTPKLNISISPHEATVKEGELVTMTCQVASSYPEYTALSWLKDGVPLEGQGALTLVLDSVTRAMGGKYQCQATNDVGLGLSEELTLRVLYAPEPSTVHIHPSPAQESTSVELVCAASANPPARNFSWFHNGAALAGETGEKVHFPSVLPRHAGAYACLAYNSLGSGGMGSPAELDVQYAPKMVEAVVENTAEIREGDPVTLSCHYNSSNPQVSHFEWRPRGPWEEPIPGVLTIPRVAWDAGPMACAACNQWCSWAVPVNLDVQYAPRGVEVRQSPLGELHAGQRVLLRCSVDRAQPEAVHVLWMRNGSRVAEGSQLVLAAITPEDAGDYSCEASNAVGPAVSRAHAVQVLYAPRRLRVSISPEAGVVEGRKVSLTCESDANPPVWQYAWFHGDSQQLQFSGPTLRLEPAQVQHSGPYWCQGANRLGIGRSPPHTLTVYYSPETIGRRTAVGIGGCITLLILAIWGIKLRHKWKRSQSQQGLQEGSSNQSFFVRNKKVRHARRSEGPPSTGCLNPMMDDEVSYAVLRFPEADTPRQGDLGTADAKAPECLLMGDEAVTYSVLQRPLVGDYENVGKAAGAPGARAEERTGEDSVHYSELVLFGAGERRPRPEEVDYVTIAQS